jgi:hypothetical protein
MRAIAGMIPSVVEHDRERELKPGQLDHVEMHETARVNLIWAGTA